MTLSFRAKTILGVALIEAVLLTVLVVLGVRFMSAQAEAEFEQRAQATVKAFAAVARDALMSEDPAALKARTQEMLTYPGVLYARVRGDQRQVLVQAGDTAALLGSTAANAAPDSPAIDPTAQHRLQLSGEVLHTGTDIVAPTQAGRPGPQGRLLGYIEIGLSAQEMLAQQATARRYGLGLAVLEMVLVALFSWALGTFLTRRLGQLSRASRQIAAGELGVQLPVQGDDELARTMAAFNHMSSQLQASYQNIRHSTQGLQQVLENILDGVITLDPNQRIVSMSPSAARILGHDQNDSMQGVSLAQFFTPPAWAMLCDALRLQDPVQLGEPMIIDGVLNTGALVPLEVRLNRLEPGRPRSEQNVAMVSTDTGAATHGPGDAAMLVVIRDIRERVEAEKALRLRGRIIDAIGVGVIIADAQQPDQPVVYANVAFERITGWRFEDVVGRNCRFLQGPDTDRHEVTRLRQAIQAGRDIEVQLLNYTRQGRPFWNELRVMPIRDSQGRLTHFVALQSDVTTRIEAQQAITRSEEQLRKVLNSTHDGIIVIDEQGLIETFNTGAEQMFGYNASEVLGRDVSLIVPPPHQAVHSDYLNRYLATGETRIMGKEREFEAVRKDGTPIWVALRVSVMDNSHDEARRFIGVVHDITQRKRAELELRHAKEAAEDAASAKSEFLANMSHEIRTPMQGVLGAIEMLQDTPITGQQERFLDTARTSASILLGVIDEILDFSRLEAGKLRIEALDFDLRRTVEDVTAMLAQRAHSRKLELACYIAPEVPEMVRSDPIRLRQILINLIGNAIKFTERGEVVVSVGMGAPAGDPAYPHDRTLRFEVRDTGIGIPSRKLTTLFEPFTQADSSTSRRFGGSGLGLSIAKRLIELMRGRIDVESQEGVGSRFWFTLPVIQPGQSLRDPRNRDFSGTRVLVVDDNATNRIILHRYLTSWSGQSSSAANAEEALAKLLDAADSGRPYEVALLDINMPGMDGYELVRHIQQHPMLSTMPLIMLSSSQQDPARMQGLRVDVWLDKPVRQSDLHDAISTVLHRRAPVPASAPVPPTAQTVHFAGERVLLVEDNPITSEVGAQMLRKRGLHITVAEDGVRAVKAVQEQAFDVVLMDIQMPDMDGYTATRVIRQWELAQGRPRLPIIALTAHALPADREKCMAAGMDDYLVKPYSAEAVSAVIARWLMPPGHEHDPALTAPQPSVSAGTTSPAGAPATAQVIDRERFEQVRMVMGSQMGPLLEKVVETLHVEINGLREAIRDREAHACSELIHRLKNTSGDIGLMHLHELASQAERGLARNGAHFPNIHLLQAACDDALAAIDHLRRAP